MAGSFLHSMHRLTSRPRWKRAMKWHAVCIPQKQVVWSLWYIGSFQLCEIINASLLEEVTMSMWPASWIQARASLLPSLSLEYIFCLLFSQPEPFSKIQSWEIYLQFPKISLICKFPCLLKLLPVNLERSASFFGLSLLSLYGGHFVNQHFLA